MYSFYRLQSAPMIQYLERKLYKLVRLPHVPDNMQYFTITMQLPTQGCLQNSLSGSDGGRLEDPGSRSTGGVLICIVSLNPPFNPPEYETNV